MDPTKSTGAPAETVAAANGNNINQPDKTGETITAPATPRNIGQLDMESGRTGTVLIHGILSDVDYNNDLQGIQRIQAYDRMRKGDATVKAGLSATKLPIMGAKWYIKPGKKFQEEQKAQRAHQLALAAHKQAVDTYNQNAANTTGTLPPPPAAPTPPVGPQDPNAGSQIMDKDEMTMFVESQLFKNSTFSWNKFLRQALTLEDFGMSAFEKVFQYIPNGQYAGKIGWKKFAQRLPQTIFKWTMNDGTTPGITQVTPTAGMREIPQWKLMLIVNEQEGSNFEGVSFLRACYQNWYYKDLYYKIDAIATERQGMGYPVITSPPQATDADKRKAQELARNIRANEQAYLDLPTGFKLEFMDTKGKDVKNITDMLHHHDRQIVKSMLAQFLELGAASSQGSFALSADQSELFLQGLHYVAKLIQEEINVAIRELIDLNYAGVDEEDYPTLQYGSLGNVDFEKLATALFRLSQGGLIKADPELERYVRNVMDLPEAVQLSEEEHDDPELIDLTDDIPSDTNIKVMQPKVYLNKEKQIKSYSFNDGLKEDLLQFSQELKEAIAAKEHA
jgi:hypothetical protein